MLVAARKQWFIDALSEALGRLDQNTIKVEAVQYIPSDVQKTLAAAGLRDEYVFPLPAVLHERPSLVGYYRLLLGASQKSFYKGATGMGKFRSMEEGAALSKKQEELLPEFCKAMSQSLAELVRQIPEMTDRDIRELPLLTFGAQLQGASNTAIGKKAMQEVFLSIAEIVGKHITGRKAEELTIRNASGREVVITLGRDPDVSVCESVGGKIHYKVAIEVKG
ncbi:MAG: XcyI family restriction endonuclease, partial [Terriglobia bacterium]